MQHNPLPWKTIWITGASSGIGRRLAIDLAGRGVTVAVSARSVDTLAVLADDHGNIRSYPLDVTDLAACRKTAEAIAADIAYKQPQDFNVKAKAAYVQTRMMFTWK